MLLNDILWLIPIAGGTLYLLYRSFWKGKGSCSGCSGSKSCEKPMPVPLSKK